MRSASILQKDNDANEVKKHLQLHHLIVCEYTADKCALWLNFRMIYENDLHGTSSEIRSEGGGITLQIKRKQKQLESSRHTCSTFRMEGSFLLYTRKMVTLHIMEPNMALFMAPTEVGKTHLVLDLLRSRMACLRKMGLFIVTLISHPIRFSLKTILDLKFNFMTLVRYTSSFVM